MALQTSKQRQRQLKKGFLVLMPEQAAARNWQAGVSWKTGGALTLQALMHTECAELLSRFEGCEEPDAGADKRPRSPAPTLT